MPPFLTNPDHRRALLRNLPLMAVVVLAAALSFGYHELLRRQRDLVEHTYRVITTLEATSSRIVDAETGQRGYVITGDEAYLAPYLRALREIPVSLEELRTLTADNPAQLQREARLSASLEGKLDELRETIVARRTRGLAAAREVVMRDRGRVLMDEARATIAEIRAAETDLLDERSAQAQTTEQRLVVVAIACALLSLVARLVMARRQPRDAAGRLGRGRPGAPDRATDRRRSAFEPAPRRLGLADLRPAYPAFATRDRFR